MIDNSYRLEKIVDYHGNCEYRLYHPTGAILYISSNIYSGSVLNYENRLGEGVDTYSQNRSLADTIRNSGREEDGTYWMEWIRGNYVVGYINSMDTVAAYKILEEATVTSHN